MRVGIVGLGLIGGSFAKAYRAAGHSVLAWNRSRSVLDFAIMSGTADGELTKENLPDCDLVLLCVYPQAAIDWLTDMAPYVGKKPLVIDCCGTKRVVCAACFPLAEQYGFTYLGGHPMAGTHNSGLKYARAELYHGAPMVIVPPVYDDIELLDRAKEMLAPAGFGHISVTTAEKHDAMIAFTSQMAHVVSNAFIKSPTASVHKGFSAGSYKDLTRVAWLNAPMWAELFMENRDYLLDELNILIDNLSAYRTAMENGDREELTRLLEEGKRRKEEVDGR
ncbi:MAG: prephenate dehydrogenase [Oscillospiraceae bacterium]|jgi:Prephenate dehydrogenase|nr:prephenate dehydrogenase [Oscillospiraceae bacterium]